VVVMKGSTLSDIKPCSPVKVNQSFGGTYYLHLQDQRVGQARNKHEAGSMFAFTMMMDVAQHRDQWRALVNTVLNLQVQ
jgi:proline racemase